MGKPTGFMEYQRESPAMRAPQERVRDWEEFRLTSDDELLQKQGARCMDCGIPFCHGMGCPLQNRIPESNDLVYRGRWQEACENLHLTNNFPEITGRLCPAPCEAACTLNIDQEPVVVRQIELALVERGLLEEAEADLSEALVSGNELADFTPYAAHLWFVRAYCEASNLRFEEAARTLRRLQADFPAAVEPVRVGARQLLLEIERRERGTLGEAATVMSYSASRLDAGDTAERLRRLLADQL